MKPATLISVSINSTPTFLTGNSIMSLVDYGVYSDEYWKLRTFGALQLYGSTGNFFILGVRKWHCHGPFQMTPCLIYFLSSLNAYFKPSGARAHDFAPYVYHAKCSEVLLHVLVATITTNNFHNGDSSAQLTTKFCVNVKEIWMRAWEGKNQRPSGPGGWAAQSGIGVTRLPPSKIWRKKWK